MDNQIIDLAALQIPVRDYQITNSFQDYGRGSSTHWSEGHRLQEELRRRVEARIKRETGIDDLERKTTERVLHEEGLDEGYVNPEIKRLTKVIGMGGIATATAKEEYPVLGTWGLGTCIGIAIYDPQNEVGGIAHVDSPPSNFHSMLRRLISEADSKGGDKYTLEVFNQLPHIQKGYSRTVQRVIDSSIKALEERISGVKYRTETEFAFDMRSGKVYPLQMKK